MQGAPHQAVTDYSRSGAAFRFGSGTGRYRPWEQARMQSLVTNTNRPGAQMNRFMRKFAALLAQRHLRWRHHVFLTIERHSFDPASRNLAPHLPNTLLMVELTCPKPGFFLLCA
jgi:hypothetical protein